MSKFFVRTNAHSVARGGSTEDISFWALDKHFFPLVVSKHISGREQFNKELETFKVMARSQIFQFAPTLYTHLLYADHDNQRLFMNYCGDPLLERLSLGSCDIEFAMCVMLQTFTAVHILAYFGGIVHCDIHANNIFIRPLREPHRITISLWEKGGSFYELSFLTDFEVTLADYGSCYTLYEKPISFGKRRPAPSAHSAFRTFSRAHAPSAQSMAVRDYFIQMAGADYSRQLSTLIGDWCSNTRFQFLTHRYWARHLRGFECRKSPTPPMLLFDKDFTSASDWHSTLSSSAIKVCSRPAYMPGPRNLFPAATMSPQSKKRFRSRRNSAAYRKRKRSFTLSDQHSTTGDSQSDVEAGSATVAHRFLGACLCAQATSIPEAFAYVPHDSPLVVVGRSRIATQGYGVFALCDISEHVLITAYEGLFVSHSSAFMNPPKQLDYLLSHTATVTGRHDYIDGYCIPPLPFYGVGHLVNSAVGTSYKANAVFQKDKDQVFVKSICTIRKGEEILTDYQYSFHMKRN